MTLKVTWAGGLQTPSNFGDMLTPKILDHFGISYEYSPDCLVISTGSIARYAHKDTMVLGSGIIKKTDKLSISANWVFVRGPLTRNRIISLGGKCPTIYGDPGLLLPLFCNESKKEYDVGLVPHQIDYEQTKLTYPNFFVINLTTDDPLKTAKEITKCRKVISSSLHGIICAHAYGIPAAWVPSDNMLKGDGIKFEDYYSSVNIVPEMSTFNNLIFTSPSININSIADIFKSLK